MATTVSFSLHFVDSFKSHHQARTKPQKQTLSVFKHHKIPPLYISRNYKNNLKRPTVVVTSFFDDPYRKTKFLSNEEVEKLKQIEGFDYRRKLPSGSVFIRAMRADEIDVTVKLLAESFAESMSLPGGRFVGLLMFIVKQYMIERRTVLPNAVMLVGFFKDGGAGGDSGEGEEECLAGTVEVSFNKLGANASPPTPLAPAESPYICNMAVKKPLRRKGIGWHLLKAGEELVSQMSSSKEVFLHCRMIDKAPLNMYIKAGYSIVKTDSILILLTLQRRKHLMRKKFPVLDVPSDSDMPRWYTQKSGRFINLDGSITNPLLPVYFIRT